MNGLDDLSVAIGGLQASQTAIQKEVAKMGVKVAEIDKTLQQARGGWKTLLFAAGSAGALGAILGKILPWWGAAS